MDLPFRKRYLLRLLPHQVPNSGLDHIEAAIYSPGFRCCKCGEYMENGFVVSDPFSMLAVHCAEPYGDTGPWLYALRNARYYAKWEHYKRERELPPAKRDLYRSLSLYSQLHPRDEYMMAMFRLMTSGKALTQNQEERALEILARGMPLDALLQVRNQVFRLGLFSLIGDLDLGSRMSFYYSSSPRRISQKDWEKLESLSRQVLGGLTGRQERMLFALGDEYAGLFDTYTQIIADAFESVPSMDRATP